VKYYLLPNYTSSSMLLGFRAASPFECLFDLQQQRLTVGVFIDEIEELSLL
jgi:hypothetical protein